MVVLCILHRIKQFCTLLSAHHYKGSYPLLLHIAITAVLTAVPIQFFSSPKENFLVPKMWCQISGIGIGRPIALFKKIFSSFFFLMKLNRFISGVHGRYLGKSE